MTSDEAVVWRLYRAKRGPLNPMLRQETGVAVLAHLLSVAHQIKNPSTGQIKRMEEFMHWTNDRDDEPEGFASKDEIMAMFPRKH